MRRVCCCSLLVLMLSWTTFASSQIEDNAAELMLLGRRVLDADDAKVVALKDRLFAFLTKYELPSPKSVNSTAKVYALFGWQPTEKAIKYSLVTLDSPSEALSAATGADIKGVHLGVSGSRTSAAKAEMPLAKYATFPVDDGFRILGAGTIKDANVSAWTNSLGLKTASALWDIISSGQSYLTILTTKFPEGEVRGQIDWNYEDQVEVVEDLVAENLRKDNNNWRVSFMTPFEEVTPVTGSKASRGMAIYAWDGSKIVYSVVSGHLANDVLSGVKGYKDITGASLHVGKRGEEAAMKLALTVPIDAEWKTEKGVKIYAQGNITDENVKALTSNANSTSGSAAIATAKALFDKIIAGETYTNVRTAANPSGEIRGQNDWTYLGMDLLKEKIPAVSSTTGGSKSFASALKPGLVSLFAVALPLLLLA